MTSAELYRLKAKECFARAKTTNSAREADRWRERGREYSALAEAFDAESSKGADPPSKLTTDE
jgi:hypothetical protein